MKDPDEIDRTIACFAPAALVVLVRELGLTVPEAAVVLLRLGLAGLHAVERFYPGDLETVVRYGQAGMEWHVEKNWEVSSA